MSQAITEARPIATQPQALALVLLRVRAVLTAVWLFGSLVVLIPVAILARTVDPRYRVYDWCSRAWARGILLIMGIRLVCRMPELPADEPYVVVANHQGALDIPALIAGLPPSMPIRFVAKRSLYFVPILGWGMHLFGHVKVDSRTVSRATSSLIEAQRALRQRRSVVFFPEGTRTHNGEIGAFRKGSFHIAAAAGARVLPVTIVGSWETLPRGRLFPHRRGTIRIEVHAPLVVSGMRPEQVEAAAEACRCRIAEALSAAAREGLV